MIVDEKGDIFENRRKPNSERRKNAIKIEKEKRKGERRKSSSGEKNK